VPHVLDVKPCVVSTSQLLGTGGGSGPLAWSPTLTQLTGCPLPQGAGIKIVPFVLEVHLSGAAGATDTLTVTKVQAAGTAYNTLLWSIAIPTGTVDAVVDLFSLIGEAGLDAGSSLTFGLSNGGTNAVTCYASYRYGTV
jgi:hypothetical protein